MLDELGSGFARNKRILLKVTPNSLQFNSYIIDASNEEIVDVIKQCVDSNYKDQKDSKTYKNFIN